MKNFDQLQDLWTENESTFHKSPPSLNNMKTDKLAFLKRQYGLSATGLFCFTLFTVWFGFFSQRNLIFELSYTALVLLALSSFIMVLINLQNVLLISRIDETRAPNEYLNDWVKFYNKRIQFIKFYGPALFIVFAISFGLYIPEILGYYPTTNYKIGFVIFTLVLFAASIGLGKQAVKEESFRLSELDHRIQMLNEESNG